VQVTKVGEDSDLSLQQGGDASTLLVGMQLCLTVRIVRASPCAVACRSGNLSDPSCASFGVPTHGLGALTSRREPCQVRSPAWAFGRTGA